MTVEVDHYLHGAGGVAILAGRGVEHGGGGGGGVTPTADYYVATDGNDGNPGTEAEPFATIGQAASVVSPGDLVYLRGGTYVENVLLSTAGTDGSPITWETHPDDWAANNPAIIQGDGKNSGAGTRAFQVQATADWQALKNLHVTESANQGLWILSDDNVVDGIHAYRNDGTGINFRDSSRNTIRNAVAYENLGGANTAVGDADGLGFSTNVGSPTASDGCHDNVVENCLFYCNGDDGIDLWAAINTIVRYSVAHHNGYQADGVTYNGGEGNGFKFGGDFGDTLEQGNTIHFCVAFDNYDEGFTVNHTGGCICDNNTAWNNNVGSTTEFVLYTPPGQTLTVRNCIGEGTSTPGGYEGADTELNNTWQSGITPEFLSTDSTNANFLAPDPAGNLIDAGYDGSDLGALQAGEVITDLHPDALTTAVF